MADNYDNLFIHKAPINDTNVYEMIEREQGAQEEGSGPSSRGAPKGDAPSPADRNGDEGKCNKLRSAGVIIAVVLAGSAVGISVAVLLKTLHENQQKIELLTQRVSIVPELERKVDKLATDNKNLNGSFRKLQGSSMVAELQRKVERLTTDNVIYDRLIRNLQGENRNLQSKVGNLTNRYERLGSSVIPELRSKLNNLIVKNERLGSSVVPELQRKVERLTTGNVNLNRLIRNLQGFLFARSCVDISRLTTVPGRYQIWPRDGGQPFLVECRFVAGVAETVIGHDSMAEVDIGRCEPSGCYKRKINYNVSMEQIIALINRSQSCRQFIKYRCVHSVMFRIDFGGPKAAWLARDGSYRRYWGGAPSWREHYCACGETNSCVDRRYHCNCDGNRNQETSDEGFLTDKDSLPVTELQFGDTGSSSEHGWHTLGPLICSGRSG